MKKILSFSLVLLMLFSFALPVMAAGTYTPEKVENHWFITIEDDVEGTLVFKDNKGKEFSVEIDGAGTYFIASQNDMNGKLKDGVGTLKAKELTYVDVLVGHSFDYSLLRQPKGPLSDLTITVTEKWERHWSNSNVTPLPDVIDSGAWEVRNNVRDVFNVAVNSNLYSFNVVIQGGGNAILSVTEIGE